MKNNDTGEHRTYVLRARKVFSIHIFTLFLMGCSQSEELISESEVKKTIEGFFNGVDKLHHTKL